MTNTYPAKAAMRRNKSSLPQASPKGCVWHRAKQSTALTNHRYLYRGYLQIAALDLTRATLNDLWLITWDPTEPVATLPLAIQKDGTWYSDPTFASPGKRHPIYLLIPEIHIAE